MPFAPRSRRIRHSDLPVPVLRAALLALLVLITVGCSPTDEPRIADFRTLGELRIAIRADAISYRIEEDGRTSGFEHDLLLSLAESLGVPARFVVYPDAARALDAVIRGQAHLAAAGLGRNERLPLRWSAPLRQVEYVIAGRNEDPEIRTEADLARRTVSVRRGSLAADKVTQIRKRLPALNVHFPVRSGDQALLEQLAAGQLDLVGTDRLHYAFATQVHRELSIAFELPGQSSIAWAMPLDDGDILAPEAEAFIARAGRTGLLARTADRYFGHVRRLDDADIATFLSRIRERLPQYREHFLDAEARTGTDWRYIAAVAYQESHWDAQATSYTGVRGMMMLTADTADSLGVSDRLDARESILGGARYLALLKDQLPQDIPEPDRSWMATAAYNLGMGHLKGARAIARHMGKDDRSWWDMKAVLPLLSRPEYAARLKAGPARGGEAVVMTENVRNFHDILVRLEPPYSPRLGQPALRLGRPD